jgi:probable rRNA maturation factor
MSELVLRNRQWVRAVDLRQLRRLSRTLIEDLLGLRGYELGVHLVAASEMTRLNGQFLQHTGSTDVITFDHSTDLPIDRPALHGEVFICLDDAVKQARQFGVTWQAELVRYIVHGLLHLLGHDDHDPVARRRMKREEDRLVTELAGRFRLSQLSRRPKFRP